MRERERLKGTIIIFGVLCAYSTGRRTACVDRNIHNTLDSGYLSVNPLIDLVLVYCFLCANMIVQRIHVTHMQD